MPQQPANSLPDSVRTDSLKKAGTASHGPHIFSGHLLKPVNKEPIPHQETSPVWPAIVLLLPVVLLVYARVKYPKKFGPLFQSFFSLQAARQLEREDYRLTRGMSIILSFVFVTGFSFFLYQYNLHYPMVKINADPLLQFHIICGAVLLMYALKFLVNTALGAVLNAGNVVYEYNFSVFLSNQGTGLFLLPVAICMQYLRYPFFYLLIAGFVILGAFYLLRIGKGVLIGLSVRNFSAFHIILYLCALEILPLIVLITFLMRLDQYLNP